MTLNFEVFFWIFVESKNRTEKKETINGGEKAQEVD